ncbi:MAG: hypothetical protein AAGA11_05535 [Pseudomonadota bacterium]
MKRLLRSLFSPLLTLLERGDGPYTYRESYRKILVAVGSLFFLLAAALVAVGVTTGQAGVAIPGVVFCAVGTTAYVVAFLGSDRAVATLWGGR